MGVKSVHVWLGAAMALAPLAAPGCSSGDGTNPPSPAIAQTASASGDGQTAQVSTLLPNPLRVLVTLSGAPQQGTSVTWAASGTGASVTPTTSLTDASGIATTAWTLGSTAGTQHATATLAGATGSPVTFSATASAAPVPVIAKTASASGDGQTALVATQLPSPIRVVVTLSGAPQQGTTVTWAAAGAGASVNPLTSQTDASGIATTTWTLGQTSGAQSATATLAGATGSPVTFSATGTAGAATQLSLSSGNNQTATVSTFFGSLLIVKVADQFNNGVAGDTVAWAVTSGPGSVVTNKSVSAATGLAQNSLIAGGTIGTVIVTATDGALTGSPVTFTESVVTAPSQINVTVGPGIAFTSARNGTSNPAVDTLAAGGQVTWTWAAGSIVHGVGSTGSPSFTSQVGTQTSGTFSVTFATPGTYTYDCTVHGTSMSGRIVVQ
jgi:plastocyanin